MRSAISQAASVNLQRAYGGEDHVNRGEDAMDLDSDPVTDGGCGTLQASVEDELVQDLHSSMNLLNETTDNPETQDEDESSDAVPRNYEQLVLKLVAEAEAVDPRVTTAKMYADVEGAAIERLKYVRHLVEETRLEMRRLRSKDSRRKMLEEFYKKVMVPRYVESLKDMQEAFRSHIIIELYREARPLQEMLVEQSGFAKHDYSSAMREEEQEVLKDSSNTFRRAASRNVSTQETTMGSADKDSTLWTYVFRPQTHFDTSNIHQLFQQARELAEARFPDATKFAQVKQTNENGSEVLIDHPAKSHGLSNLVALLFYPPTALTAGGRFNIPATRAVLYHIQLLAHRNEILPHLQWAFDAIREICWSQLAFGLLMAPRMSNRERHKFVSAMLSYERERSLAAELEPQPQWENFNMNPDEVLLRCGLVQPDRYFPTEDKGRQSPSVADHYYSEWKEGGLVPMCDAWRTGTTEDYFVKLRRSNVEKPRSGQRGKCKELCRETLTGPSAEGGLLTVAEPLCWFEDDLPLRSSGDV